MRKASSERGDVFAFSREPMRSNPPGPASKSVARPAVRHRPNVNRRAARWQSAALFGWSLLLLLSIGVAFHAFQKAALVQQELTDTVEEMTAAMQELKASVSHDSVRRELLLGMRDEILRVNPTVSLDEAYRYAELLLTATEKYASVDPLLLLSIGIVESGFDTRARSHADARGLYQIWPSTGRMLAGMLGWEYSDEMLYDASRNTEMAALYLDILMTTYNDLGMALAEYNGGPVNAGYYRARSGRLATETLEYVPKVLGNYERLAKHLPLAPGRSYDVLYRDPARDGKMLGVARRSRETRKTRAD